MVDEVHEGAGIQIINSFTYETEDFNINFEREKNDQLKDFSKGVL